MNVMDLSSIMPKANSSPGSEAGQGGPSAPSAPIDGEAPPPYTTLPRSPSEVGATSWSGHGRGSVAMGGGGGYAPSGIKLGYVDFVPRLTKKKVFKEDEYETFDILIERANSWLEEHQGLQIVSMETVTWSGLSSKEIFPDSAVFARSMNGEKMTKFLRGIRLWYFIEVFPSAQSNQRAAVVQCRTFVPKGEEKFDQLMTRVNASLSNSPLGGRIISIETVPMVCTTDGPYRSALVNPSRCFWKEDPASDRRYSFCIRIYATFGEEVAGYETINYQDFVPEYNQRNKENGGFEVFSDLMQKATRWIARQQGVRFTNIQSLNVKLKKDQPYVDRCVYIEHLCANNRTNIFAGPSRSTHYVRLIRTFYVVVQMAGARPEFPPLRMTFRTFTPAQMTPATTTSAPEYEGMRQVLERMNQWLQITGARVFSIETLPLRMTLGNLQLLGTEATYSKNATMSGSQYSEKWLYHIRIYLDGEYLEPPGAVSLVVPNMSPMPRMQ